MIFEGCMVALVTPFRGGKIDEEALKRLIEFHISRGTKVIVPCGTTGESATLSHAEHERVVGLTVSLVNRRAKVLAGAGSNSTAEAIRLHKAAALAHADGALHITPYYNKPTQAGLIQHFTAIAKSADLPVVLYNIPGRTCVNMLPATTIELSKIDTIVGIKEGSGNLSQAGDIIAGVDQNFAVICGDDELAYAMYCLGAKGVISVTANLVPDMLSQQYASVVSGDYKKALAIHNKLLRLHRQLFVETNPIPIKAALHMMGLIEEELRLPLTPLTAGNRETLKAVMKDMGLIS